MPRRRRGWAMSDRENVETRHSPLTTALLEPVLLILLKQTPRHGYSLLPALESLNMGSIHPAVVYRTLRDMEYLGWISSQWDTDQSQGPPRRIYSLSEDGEFALQNWQSEMLKIQQIIAGLLDEDSQKGSSIKV